MNVVCEYTLVGDAVLDLPFGTQILNVGTRDEEARMWALVNLDQSQKVRRKFIVVGTGEMFKESPYNHGYVGTVLHNGLVFHVLEVKEGA